MNAGAPRDERARAILARAPALASLDDVRELLQFALEVERFTLPPYLTALYSIRDGTNLEAVSLLRSVVVEEMLHMALVCNLLNSIAGAPRVNAPEALQYPATLPFSADKFVVNIGPFSRAAVETFCQIEQPAGPDAQPEGPYAYNELSQFYRYVANALTALEQSTPGGIFTGDPTRQVGPDDYYSAGGLLFPVCDLASARAAIDSIIVQGESTPGSVSGGDETFGEPFELAHFYRFDSIRRGRRYQHGDAPGAPSGRPIEIDWAAVANVPLNLTVDSLSAFPAIQESAIAFNEAWRTMLSHLNEAFNGVPSALRTVIPDMFALKYQAQALMRIPLPGTTHVAGPDWELPPTTTL